MPKRSDRRATLATMTELSRTILTSIDKSGDDGLDVELLTEWFERRKVLFDRLREAPIDTSDELRLETEKLLELDGSIIDSLAKSTADVKQELMDLQRRKRALQGYRHQTRPRGSTTEA